MRSSILPLLSVPLALLVVGCCKPGATADSGDSPAGAAPPQNTRAGQSPAAAPPKPALPDQAPGAGRASPDVPSGVSAPPTVAEWQAAPDVNSVGANSAPTDCQLKMVREWLKVHCDGKVTEVTKMEGFGKKGVDYFESIRPGAAADFVVRVRKGNAMKLRIMRSAPHSASLFVNWPSGKDRPTIVALQIYNGPP